MFSKQEDLFASDESLDVEMQNYSPESDQSQPIRPRKPIPFCNNEASLAFQKRIVDQCIAGVVFKPIQTTKTAGCAAGCAGRRKLQPSQPIFKPIPLKCICKSTITNHPKVCKFRKQIRQLPCINNVNNQLSSLDFEGMVYFRKTPARASFPMDEGQASNANGKTAFQARESDVIAMDEITEKLSLWNLNNRTDAN